VTGSVLVINTLVTPNKLRCSSSTNVHACLYGLLSPGCNQCTGTIIG